MHPPTSEPTPSTSRLVAGFLAIYLVWGSTYLAIRIAIETLPPFLMAAARFLVAGGILWVWALRRGVPAPTRRQLVDGAVVGALLLWMGNGAVVWAEQWVPSGLAALLVATLPFWMVLLDWVWAGATRPAPAVWAALVAGLGGVALLTSDGGFGGGGPGAHLGAWVILGGSLSWAVGSIYSRKARMPAAPRMATAIQMVSGGLLLLATGTVTGEWAELDPGTVSLRSVAALAYLIVFGSLVAFLAYIWLLRVSTPARVSTYAYVNPVVALLLGWAVADEPLTPRTLLAGAVILASVAALNLLTRRRRRAAPPSAAPRPDATG